LNLENQIVQGKYRLRFGTLLRQLGYNPEAVSGASMNFLKRLWPWWIPTPFAAIEAIIINLMMLPVVYSVYHFGKLGFHITESTGNLGPIAFCIVFGYIFPFIIFAYIHSLLFGKKPANWPKNLPAPKSILESICSLAVVQISGLFSLVLILFFLNIYKEDYSLEYFEGIFHIYTAAYFILEIYLFHAKRSLIKGVFQEKQVPNKATTPKPTTKQKPVPSKALDNPFGEDDLERELALMKIKMATAKTHKQ
jgi:hypothetical protein